MLRLLFLNQPSHTHTVREKEEKTCHTFFLFSQVDEAVAFDLAVLIRSSMPSVAANLVYDNCSAFSSVNERDLEQSRRLIDALQQVRLP